jgi:hypothetical protein
MESMRQAGETCDPGWLEGGREILEEEQTG